jgi:hypothetical protein
MTTASAMYALHGSRALTWRRSSKQEFKELTYSLLSGLQGAGLPNYTLTTNSSYIILFVVMNV